MCPERDLTRPDCCLIFVSGASLPGRGLLLQSLVMGGCVWSSVPAGRTEDADSCVEVRLSDTEVLFALL